MKPSSIFQQLQFVCLDLKERMEEGLNKIRSSVYRVSMKLLCLQKNCHMDVVSLRHIVAAFHSVGRADLPQDVRLNMEEVACALSRVFHSVSQEVAGHVTAEALEETCSLMFRLFDRCQDGVVSAASLQTALIALSAETLLLKYRALLNVAENGSGFVSRSGLRSLLQDLSQIPMAVQEEGLFGEVEVAVKSCFNGVSNSTVSEEHVLSWLQSEPSVLLWLPTLYRLSISQNVSHSVHCHTCKTSPITGLRYRCLKCVNIHMCQSCFLTDRQTRKHKTHHPVLEFCTQGYILRSLYLSNTVLPERDVVHGTDRHRQTDTQTGSDRHTEGQPTWRESLSWLMHSARHALLPWQRTQNEAERRRVLMWAGQDKTQNRALPTSKPLPVSHNPSSESHVSHDACVQPPPCFSSKALQTEEERAPEQALTLLTEVKNLQRDKWLLEQQLQAWQLTIQSEQGILEDRCSGMEVTMETLRAHNLCLQSMLTQALDKMETQQYLKNTPQSVDTETEVDVTACHIDRDKGDKKEEDEDVLLNTEEKWCRGEKQTSSPSMLQNTPPSCDSPIEEEESAGDSFLCHPIRQQDGPEEAEQKEEDTCLIKEVQYSEELLRETVERLKTVMETDRWRDRQIGKKRAALLVAAEQVGVSIYHLVDTVQTDIDTH